MSENNINGNSAEEKLSENGLPDADKPVTENDHAGPEENSEPKVDTGNSESDSDNTESNPAESEEDSGTRFQEYFNEAVENHNPKMTDTLLTFYELRSIDEELTDIEDEKGDLPDKISSIKSNIGSIETDLSGKKQSLKNIEAEKLKLTEDINSFEERINKYDEQKYDVRSNKEYDEIVKTIEGMFEEVKKSEVRLKEIDDIQTSLVAETESMENKLNELSSELSENQALLDELDEQYKTDESGLKEKRNILLDKIDAASRTLYERINKSHKGEATAIVRKGNCSGCYNSIPPQRVIEIKSAERIFTCQSCGRILIAEELISLSNK
ncbi:MAG: hypothetical protein IPL53_05460 [Ignavibacteria bacterium]|nr:hypothetical protein [Ignavibacteria bacterium]